MPRNRQAKAAEIDESEQNEVFLQPEHAMGLTFEWDKEKAARNLTRHRVSFDEASTVFSDPLSRTIPDPLHSEEEDRFVMLGESHRFRLLVVVFTERGDNIRIISARRASRRERIDYEKGANEEG